MKVVIQKVKSASVTVDTKVVSSIQKGLMLLVGISTEDTEQEVEKLSSKILKLRLFEDESGTMWKKPITEINGQILSVSQFTLMARTKKGSKPDFHLAAKGADAKVLYESFLSKLKANIGDENVKDGVFGAMMDVALVNDGPVTITIDSTD